MYRPSLLARRSICLANIDSAVRASHFYRNSPHCTAIPLILQKPSAVRRDRFRQVSTLQTATNTSGFLVTRFKNLLVGAGVTVLLYFGYFYVTDVRAGIHQWAVAPSLRLIYDDAEEAHEAGTESLKGLYSWGLHPRERGNDDKKGDLSVEVRVYSVLQDFE